MLANSKMLSLPVNVLITGIVKTTKAKTPSSFFLRPIIQTMNFQLYSTQKKDAKKLKIHRQPPVSDKFDLIGPPDPISNIRPIQFHVPKKETSTEKSFRLRRSEILQWNQNFWAEHNSSFFKEKEEYIGKHQTTDTDGQTSISSDELSVFYKRFLDENRKSHLNYNKEWYKQNISLLWPALKVAWIRMKRKFKGVSH